MNYPQPQYVQSGDVHIAYQVVGDGPIDLIHAGGIWSNLDVMWEWPPWERFLRRLASFSRLILFDMRGVGLSDRGERPPTLEAQMDDVAAVMKAAHSENPVIFGIGRGAAMALGFTASHPEQVRALALYAPVARHLWAEDWPFGRTAEEQKQYQERFMSAIIKGKGLVRGEPSQPGFQDWWSRFQRLAASPGAWLELIEVLSMIDVRAVLPHIHVPTLILQREQDPLDNLRASQAIARQIQGCRFTTLLGHEYLPFLGDADSVLDEIEEFVTGARPSPVADRVLATVLFTDIVGSTERASEVGDREWRSTLKIHNDAVSRQLGRFRGRRVKNTGDGVLAIFDGPGRAIRCATALMDELNGHGITIRAGIHAGEVELLGEDIGGIAVHIAQRVESLAEPLEILVSSTVKDLVEGSGMVFTELGRRELKGVTGEWTIFRAVP